MSLQEQARRLRAAFQELLRRRQLRDREKAEEDGLSPSQRDALEAVDRLGPLTMRRLADRLHVDAGGMTRIIDSLEEDGLVVRFEDPNDRRACCVKITGGGKDRITEIHSDLIRECRRVLRETPVKNREAVIASVTHLLPALHVEQLRSSAPGPGRRPRAGRARSSRTTGRKGSNR